MTNRAIFLAALLVFPVLAFAADTDYSQLQTLASTPRLSGDDPHWLLAQNSQCWLFDSSPLPEESVEWSGDCKDHVASGEGTATWYLRGRLAEKWTGNFVEGSLNGQGTATTADGSTYEGGWAYSTHHGHGLLRMSDGEIYDGDWPGEGTYTNARGETCSAEVVRNGGKLSMRPSCARRSWKSP